MMPMGSPLATNFYVIDSDSPTISAYPRSSFHAWFALSAALANHYGVDAESIHTAEAYWNGDREYRRGCDAGRSDRRCGGPANLIGGCRGNRESRFDGKEIIHQSHP